jgi:Protein of unknown function (DUF2934)
MPKALRTTETRRRTTPVGSTQPLQTHDAIARRAYELYVQRGGEPGRDWEDWFAAERDLRSPAGYGVTRGREAAHRPRAAPPPARVTPTSRRVRLPRPGKHDV